MSRLTIHNNRQPTNSRWSQLADAVFSSDPRTTGLDFPDNPSSPSATLHSANSTGGTLRSAKEVAMKIKKKKRRQHLFNLSDVIRALEIRLKREKFVGEISLYVTFATILFTIIFLQRNIEGVNDMHWALDDLLFDEEFNPSDSHILKNFYNIHSVDEVWQWLKGPFVNALTYSNNCSQVEQQHLYNVNRQIGGLRFRTFRIKPDSCPKPDRYKDLFPRCTWWYYFWNKETEPYGNSTTFTYKDNLAATNEFGKVAYFYGKDGYPYIIKRNEDLLSKVQELQDSNYLDFYTRALMINLNTYNANYDTFGSVVIIFEFGPGGRVLSWAQFRWARIDNYSSPADTFRAVLEMVFLILLVYYIYREYQQYRLCLPENPYFRDPWNTLEVIIIFLFLIILFVYFEWTADPLRFQIREYPQQTLGTNNYIPIDPLLQTVSTMASLLAISILLVFIKIFKYLQLNRRMLLLWTTLGSSATDLAMFFFFFSIVFFGYSIFAHILFGVDVSDFKSLNIALTTCFRMAVGDFEYSTIQLSNRLLAPVFFTSFVVLVYFTLANMFLAIINDTYLQQHAVIKNKTQISVNSSFRSRLKAAKNKFFAIFHIPADDDFNQDRTPDDGHRRHTSTFSNSPPKSERNSGVSQSSGNGSGNGSGSGSDRSDFMSTSIEMNEFGVSLTSPRDMSSSSNTSNLGSQSFGSNTSHSTNQSRHLRSGSDISVVSTTTPSDSNPSNYFGGPTNLGHGTNPSTTPQYTLTTKELLDTIYKIMQQKTQRAQENDGDDTSIRLRKMTFEELRTLLGPTIPVADVLRLKDIIYEELQLLANDDDQEHEEQQFADSVDEIFTRFQQKLTEQQNKNLELSMANLFTISSTLESINQSLYRFNQKQTSDHSPTPEGLPTPSSISTIPEIQTPSATNT